MLTGGLRWMPLTDMPRRCETDLAGYRLRRGMWVTVMTDVYCNRSQGLGETTTGVDGVA